MFERDHLLRDSKLILCAPYPIPSQPTLVALFVLIHRTQKEVRKENLAMLCACEPRENWGHIPHGCHWSYANDREERNMGQSHSRFGWLPTSASVTRRIWWNPAKRILYQVPQVNVWTPVHMHTYPNALALSLSPLKSLFFNGSIKNFETALLAWVSTKIHDCSPEMSFQLQKLNNKPPTPSCAPCDKH